MPIFRLSTTRTPLDTSTHTDVPTCIRMGGTPLWDLNLPMRVVLMELELWPLPLDWHLAVRPRSREWIRPVRGGRRVQVALRGRWRGSRPRCGWRERGRERVESDSDCWRENEKEGGGVQV